MSNFCSTFIISRLADISNVDGRKSSGAPQGGNDAARPRTTHSGVSWLVALSARLWVWKCASLDLALRLSRFITRRRKSSEVVGDAYKQNGNVIASLNAAAKPTIGVMIKTTGQEIERRLEAAKAVKPATVTAPSPEPPALHLDAREVGTAPPFASSKQSGCGRAKTTRRRRRALVHGLYKGAGKLARSVMYPQSNFFSYNF